MDSSPGSVACVFMGLGGGGVVYEFKAAVSGHAPGKVSCFGVGVHVVNGAEGLRFVVAYVNKPDGYLVAFVVGVGLGSVKEHTAPWAGGGGLLELLVHGFL